MEDSVIRHLRMEKTGFCYRSGEEVCEFGGLE
jgi:hypothetical protein